MMNKNAITEFLLEAFRIFRPNQRTWMVRIFIVSGIPLVSSSFWQPWVEAWLERELGFSVSYVSTPGWILIAIGIIIYIFNHYNEVQAAKEPTFKEDQTDLTFSLGGGLSSSYSVKELRATAVRPFDFGGHLPIRVYLEGNKLYADVEIFSRSNIPPIKIIKNRLSGLPSSWDSNRNERALEIVNGNRIPIYQFIYMNDGHIKLNGVFPFPGGLVLANDENLILNPASQTPLGLSKIFKYPSWKYPAVYEEYDKLGLTK